MLSQSKCPIHYTKHRNHWKIINNLALIEKKTTTWPKHPVVNKTKLTIHQRWKLQLFPKKVLSKTHNKSKQQQKQLPMNPWFTLFICGGQKMTVPCITDRLIKTPNLSCVKQFTVEISELLIQKSLHSWTEWFFVCLLHRTVVCAYTHLYGARF